MRSMLVHPSVPNNESLLHRHRVTRLADFLVIDHSARGVIASFGFPGGQWRSVDRGSAKEEPDFLRRTFAFALAVEIYAADVSAGFAKRNGHVVTGAARLAELGLVLFRIELGRHDSQRFGDGIGKFGMAFHAFHARLPPRVDAGTNNGGRTRPARKIDIFDGRL